MRSSVLLIGLVAAIATVAVACARGPSAIESGTNDVSLIGGTPAKPGDEVARSVVQFREKGSQSRSICTGVLVSKTMILTAAHCVLRLRADRQNLEYHDNFEVVFDVDAMTKDRSRIRGVKEIFTHAEFNPDHQRCGANPAIDGCKEFLRIPYPERRPHVDVAIVVLDKPAPRDMVPLKPFQGKSPHDFEAIATGAGLQVPLETIPKFNLSAARSTTGRIDFYPMTVVLTTNPFEGRFRNAWGYSDKTFCVEASKARTTSKGDSGSPLLIRTPKGLQIYGILHGGSPKRIDNRNIEMVPCYTDITRDDWVGMNTRGT